MARFKRTLRPRASWQGPVGAGCIVASVALLSAWPWGLLAAGGFLLLATALGAR